MTPKFREVGYDDHVTYRLQESRTLLEWLGGELLYWARTGREAEAETRAEPGTDQPDADQPDQPDQPSEAADGPGYSCRVARRVDRLAMQLSRVSRLASIAVDQLHMHGDLGTAWILLEQSRQQLGHAWAAAGTIDQSARLSEDDVVSESGWLAHLLWFLQRDLMPWPEEALGVVDFGSGPGALPDFRPDGPADLVPLQLLAHAAMTFSAGNVVQDDSDTVMTMAFGEYVWTVMDQAMELLEFAAQRASEPDLGTLAHTGREAAELIAGAFPPAWQLFHGPAGFPGSE